MTVAIGQIYRPPYGRVASVLLSPPSRIVSVSLESGVKPFGALLTRFRQGWVGTPGQEVGGTETTFNQTLAASTPTDETP